MKTPENRGNEAETLKDQIAADMQAQGLNLSDATITKMTEIITDVRDAETAGDIRDLLGSIDDPIARVTMRSLSSNTTAISDDMSGWRIRRTTAQLLAEDAFGNGKHAQSPRLIPYCAGRIPRPSTAPGIQDKTVRRTQPL